MKKENLPDEKSLKRVIDRLCDAADDQITSWALNISDRTESPIERLLLTALFSYIAVRGTGFTHVVWIDPKFPADIKLAPPVSRFTFPIFVETQKLVEGVRVDFLISVQVVDMGSGDTVGVARLIVECDGHSFHERTKEQAARDRGRDRLFQEKGYTVFRFTGSEIYKGAWECAFQIFNWASDRAWK